MSLIIIVVLVIFVLAVLVKLAGLKNGKRTNNAKLIIKKPLSEIEQIAFWRIKEAVGIDKTVLCQVAFSSFLKAEKNNKDGFAKFATARQKVADFVICNKDFSIFAIIEIDDKSHSVNRDLKRDEITNEVGIKTYRYQAKNLPSVDEIKKEMLL